MKHAYFKVAEDLHTGETGLLDSRMNPDLPYPNVITSSQLFAHDLVEHVNGVKRIGTIADELEAIGAMHFVRGEVGDYQTVNPITPEEAVSAEIFFLWQEYENSDERLVELKLVPIDPEAEEFWEMLTSEGYFQLFKAPNEFNPSQEFLHLAKRYWLLGYHKAEQLYGNSMWAYTYFCDLKYIADPLFKQEFTEEDLGRTFMLKHSPNAKPILKETTRGRYF